MTYIGLSIFEERKLIALLRSIKYRCNGEKGHYKVKGIKCFLSYNDLKKLWIRDQGYFLKRPSIDRVDNNGNYEFLNCRFIELIDNIKLSHKIMRKFTCLLCSSVFLSKAVRAQFCSRNCYKKSLSVSKFKQ